MAQRSRTDLRKCFFSNRATNALNTIPTEIKEKRKLNRFKAKLDEYRMDSYSKHVLDDVREGQADWREKELRAKL